MCACPFHFSDSLWKCRLGFGTSHPSQVTTKLHAYAGAQPWVWVPSVSKAAHGKGRLCLDPGDRHEPLLYARHFAYFSSQQLSRVAICV